MVRHKMTEIDYDLGYIYFYFNLIKKLTKL